MTSIVDIWNRALGAIGTRNTVTTLAEVSPEANNCRLYYDEVRTRVQAAAQWDCLKRNANLTLLDTAPIADGTTIPASPPTTWSFMPWAYKYAWPPDAVRFCRILPPINPTQGPGIVPYYDPQLAPNPGYGQAVIRWEKRLDLDAGNNEIRTICTNQVNAVGQYIRGSTDPNIWDEGLRTAIIGGLAQALVMPLSGNLEYAKLAISAGAKAMKEAQADDGNEGVQIQGNCADWIAVSGGEAVMSDGWGYNAPYGWGGGRW